MTATPTSAQRALNIEAALLPRLTNRTDSVEARLRRLEAYLHLNDQTSACALLEQLTRQAAGTRFERATSNYLNSPALQCSRSPYPY